MNGSMFPSVTITDGNVAQCFVLVWYLSCLSVVCPVTVVIGHNLCLNFNN